MSRTYGVVTGTVVKVDDPQREGRVLVRFPWLPEKNEGYWAPVATLMAGGTRGSWFMPEKGDEVLVAFDQGDVNHPYIVGFLWNGADKPPGGGTNASVRQLRTVSGHTLEFDDNAGQERVRLRTQGENEIELKDTPLPSITITTAHGHRIHMQESLPAGITIETTGGQKVVLSDQPLPSITIHAAMSDIVVDATGITITTPAAVNVNCLTANISATGTLNASAPVANVTAATVLNATAPIANISAAGLLNVNAPLTNFNGIVRMQTLIAQMVVSQAYTPGRGNRFGL